LDSIFAIFVSIFAIFLGLWPPSTRPGAMGIAIDHFTELKCCNNANCQFLSKRRQLRIIHLLK